MAFDLHALLRRMIKEKASDLFLKEGSPPSLRIDGKIRFLQAPPVGGGDVDAIIATLTRARPSLDISSAVEEDVAYDLPGLARFRINIYRQRGRLSFAIRAIAHATLDFAALGLPEKAMRHTAALQRGLVLVTGTAGSGKSTSLAALLTHMNLHSNRHIITIEDPIEYTFRDNRCIISQREIGVDTADFKTALRQLLRQSPDVIMIGELRDAETMSAALSAAESGHLVLSTLHTTNTQQTVERILTFFPPHQEQLIRMQLSMVLQVVVSQRLLPRKGKQGRALAAEIMVVSPTLRELLHEGKTHSLKKLVHDDRYFGSQTFHQSLKQLYEDGMIELDDALAAADSPDELRMELRGVTKGASAHNLHY